MKFWIADIASIVLDWSKLELGDSLYKEIAYKYSASVTLSLLEKSSIKPLKYLELKPYCLRLYKQYAK